MPVVRGNGFDGVQGQQEVQGQVLAESSSEGLAQRIVHGGIPSRRERANQGPAPLSWAVKWLTPHGFSKDGKSNGPSGNELGRAVNQALPTPTSSRRSGLQSHGVNVVTGSPEPSVGRVAHGVPKRVDRLKGLGNAVIPRIPELIARRILEVL